jgi:hypothetical protein
LPRCACHLADPTCPPEWLSSALSLSTNYDGPQCRPPPPHVPVPVFPYVDPVQFALNLEFTEAEFFLHAAFGVGLDQIAPKLALGGPPPVGVRKANLDEVDVAHRRGVWVPRSRPRQVSRSPHTHHARENTTRQAGIVLSSCERRAIERTVGGIPRPLIDLSAHNFARVMDMAFEYRLDPPFHPYIGSLNFLLASYVIPYLGINGYVGTNPIIDGHESKRVGTTFASSPTRA